MLVWKHEPCHVKCLTSSGTLFHWKGQATGLHSSRVGDLLSSRSCRDVFSGKVFKTLAAGGGNRRESKIRTYCTYVCFKGWVTPAEFLGTESQANEDITRWVHYQGIFIITPWGQPLVVLLVGAWEGTLCSESREVWEHRGKCLFLGQKKPWWLIMPCKFI